MANSIIFVSGKGGVGKTMISTNVSTALARSGKRVLLLDADFGLANANIMLGIKGDYSLADVLEGSVDINSAISETKDGLRILCGGSGLSNLVGLDQEARFRIIRLVEPLEDTIDYLIIDAPAGIEDNALCYAGASDEICLILTTEPTSFMDAYATVKVLSMEKKINKIKIIVNMAESISSGKAVFGRFQDIVCRFLPVTLELTGVIPSSKNIQQSIVNRSPMSKNNSNLKDISLLSEISHTIVNNIKTSENNNLSFFQGLLSGVA